MDTFKIKLKARHDLGKLKQNKVHNSPIPNNMLKYCEIIIII